MTPGKAIETFFKYLIFWLIAVWVPIIVCAYHPNLLHFTFQRSQEVSTPQEVHDPDRDNPGYTPEEQAARWEKARQDYAKGHPGPEIVTLPNFIDTPGVALKDVTWTMIARHGYSASVRDVPESVKKEVMAKYLYTWDMRDQFEIDHLIPLCIGGSNDPHNLWPQPYNPPDHWGARVKDRLERELLKRVRDHTMTLEDAQKGIAKDWISFYKEVFKTEEPIEAHILEEEQ